MTHRLPTLLCSGLLLLALAACYDNDPPTAEPQPRPGSATIVPDWGDAEGTAVRTLVMAHGQDGSLSPGSLSPVCRYMLSVYPLPDSWGHEGQDSPAPSTASTASAGSE